MTNHSFRYNLGQLDFKMAFGKHILHAFFIPPKYLGTFLAFTLNE